MATSSPRAQVVLDGDVGPLRQKLREATTSINAFGRDSASAMSDTLGPAQALQARLAGIAATITGGAFAAFIKSSINMQDEMSKSAQKAGVTTEQYSGMAYAAKLADVEVEALGKAYAKLSALLSDGQQGQKEAVETFRRLKLDPKGIKDADQLLLELAERFSSMDDGARKTGLAIDVFGEKLGPRLIPFLNAGREGLAELREEALRLGVVVDTKTGKAAEEFNDTLTRMQTATQGMGMQIAKALLPALQAVATEFLNVKREGNLADVMAEKLRVTFEALAVLGANVGFVFGGIGREIGAIMAQVSLLWEVLRAPPTEILATAKRNWAGFNAISEAVKADGVRARAALDDFEQRVMQLGKYSPEARAAEDDGKGATKKKPFVPGDKKLPDDKDKADPAQHSVLATYELVLAEEKRVSAILDQGAEYGKERELGFWRAILASAQMGVADRTAILRKAAGLEVEIAGKAAKERKALDAEMLTQSEALALGRVDGERAASKAALDLGLITSAQQLQLDLQYETQRYEIQRNALAARMQLLAADPTTSEVEKQRVLGRMLQLEQQYQQGMLQLQTSLAKQGIGTETFTAIGDSFGNALNGMLTRTQTWYGALASIFTGVRDIFITEVITKPFAQYIASQAKMLAVKLGFVASEKAAVVAGATATTTAKTGEAAVVVAANAAEAGSGAASAMASIPWVGPVLALAAMAAVFAAVSGLASAEGGFDIPSGVNPMTQLHQEEMVLPAHIANPLRGALADGSLGGGGERSGGDLTVEVRGASAGEFFLVHKKDLVKALKAARRDLDF